MNQKHVGVIISYLNLILGMVVNIFLTPLLITSLGDLDYSIYKVMQSFAGPLAMFNLGVSTIVTRSIVKFQNDKTFTEENKKNTLALSVIASSVMAAFVIMAGFVMFLLIPTIYGDTYDSASITLGREIFVLFILSSVFHMLTDAFSGCMIGHKKFAVSSSVTFVKTALKILLIVVLLKIGMGALYVVAVDLLCSILVFVFSVVYSSAKLGEKPKLTSFDKKQMMEILMFGLAILLQAFVNQVNNNMDTMILGAYIDEKAIITMYSSALAIYSVYNSLISAITNFFLPKATKLITTNASGKELTDFVIGPGRYQAIIAVGCVCGFALFGRNFVSVWIGDKYSDAYWITLMLMIPVTIPLVENTAIAILDASLKRIYRSIVLVVMAVVNLGISIVLINIIGFWGAAVGTVISLTVGHIILMNIYYAKTFKMEIFRMFRSIFKGILPAGLVASVLCVPLSIFLPNTLIYFILKCFVFIVLFAVTIMLFGINKDEKKTLLRILRRSCKRHENENL